MGNIVRFPYPTARPYSRYIHENVLKHKALTGFQKVYLSVLMASSTDGVCRESDAELARRVNIYTPPKQDYIRQTNKRLEDLGIICRRHVRFSRIREIVLRPGWRNLARGKYDLIVQIFPTSRQQRISYEQMIVWGHTNVFNMPLYIRSELLGTSTRNIRRVQGLLPPKPIRFGPPNLSPVYIEQTESNFKTTDSKESDCFKTAASNEAEREARLPRYQIKYSVENRKMTDTTTNGFNRQSVKNAKPTYPVKAYKNCAEIDEVWNSFPYLQKHKDPSKKVYQRAAAYLRYLEHGQLDKIVDRSILMGKMRKQIDIKQSEIPKLYGRVWTKEERLEVYRRLNEMRRPGSKFVSMMPADLPSLVYNERTGMSWFVYAFLKKVDNGVVDEGDFEQALEHVRSCATDNSEKVSIKMSVLKYVCEEIRDACSFPDFQKDRDVLNAATELWEFYEKAGLYRLPHIRILDGGFHEYIDQFVRWIKENYDLEKLEVNVGWFRPKSRPHFRFLYWLTNYYLALPVERGGWESYAEFVNDLLEARFAF